MKILYVEDVAADAVLLRDALEATGLGFELHIETTGPAALAYLQRTVPDLVLLDLNLPGMKGQEALAQIRRDARLRLLPVVVFTTSSFRPDILSSYGAGANAVVRKPSDLDGYQRVVRSLAEFWLRAATLPGEEKP